MSSFSPASLLGLWERVAPSTPARRPLLMLAAAHPEREPAEWERLEVAARDAALLDLREELFGRELRSLVPCPRCGAKTELLFHTDEVRPTVLPRTGEPIPFQAGRFTGTFRLPRSGDWLDLPPAGAGGEAVRDAISRRCLVSLATGGGTPVAGPPPDEVLAVIGEEIARHDAHAHTELNVTCPDCAHAWSAVFDIASFLWRELDATCRRLLDQVHRLALAYGWSEAEVLRLSQARRECYLAMIANG